MPRHLLPALVLLAAVPAVALAQDRPQIFPTRDVAVSYRFLGNTGGGPQGMNVSWQASTQTMRNDIPGMGWMVADHRNQRGFMVMEQMRMIMDVPMGQVMQQYGPSDSATYRREGTATVAGLSCTVWSYEDRGNRGRACITSDGVTLRAEGTHQGQSGGMEATQVSYGPQDASRFQRPQGYGTMQVPQGGAMRPPQR
jgi:hypothetical protein